jgi:hypothetical protein
MSDLTQFLRDRYTEARKTEEGKRRSIPSVFDGHDVVWEVSSGDERLLIDGQPYPVDKYIEIATEADPDPFTLADLDAKEEILQACEEFLHEYEGGPDPCASSVLRSLARPYRERPDFNPAWLAA